MKFPDRWTELSPLFDELIDLPAAGRAARLQGLRETDSQLADELGAMLVEADRAGRNGFLEQPLPLQGVPAASDLRGTRLGAYCVEEELGRGGWGSVWKARRVDGRFDGFVAIKLLHSTLAGRHGVDRFHREGAILARLSHPNIARLLDAGLTDEGQPYLVLELVDGRPIDAYCDEHRLGIAERLGLLCRVMAAVSHAHARLIVHRDLKPSNILVTPEADVKLLDFGIAKLLQDEFDDTALTGDGQRMLTPRYAAPEQLEGAPISTGTDVYALGVLMYRLLAGRYPTAIDGASATEVMTGTLTVEPAPMGSALDRPQSEAEVDAEEIAERRGTTVNALRRQLRGDLDAIVARALRKQPRERYESVAALSADVERYLGGQPVSARSGSTRYRLGKLLRRHKAAALASVLLLASITTGLVATAEQARRAQRERDAALHQLRGAEATREFVQFLLSEGSDAEPVATALLERGDRLIEREFANDAEDQARLQLLLASLYAEAGLQPRSEELLQRAARNVAHVDDANLKMQIQCQLAVQVADNGRFGQAMAMFDRAIAQLRPSDTAADRATLASCLHGRSVARSRAGAFAGALDDVQDALALMGSPRPDQRPEAIDMRASMASIQGRIGNAANAAVQFRRALADLDALGRGETRVSRTLYNNLGVLLYGAGRPLEASQAFARAMEISHRLGHLDPLTEGNFARVLIELGRPGEALPLAEHALRSLPRVADSTLRGSIAFFGAPAWCETGDTARCAALLRQARDIFAATPPQEKAAIPNLRMQRAMLLERQGALAGAREEMRRAAEELEGLRNRIAPRAYALLARLELQAGEAAEAQVHAEKAIALAQARGTGYDNTAWHGSAVLSLGLVQKAQGEPAARETLAAALAELRDACGEAAPETERARAALTG